VRTSNNRRHGIHRPRIGRVSAALDVWNLDGACWELVRRALRRRVGQIRRHPNNGRAIPHLLQAASETAAPEAACARVSQTVLTTAVADELEGRNMKDADFSPGFKRLLRRCLFGARGGLSVGFAISSATLGSWLTPSRYAWLAFALVGASMSVVYWWVWGKIFKNVGLTVK